MQIVLSSSCSLHWEQPHPTRMHAQVSRERGVVEAWQAGGRSLLEQGITPSLFRAPTDNDRGGSGGTSYVHRCPPPRTPACKP